jgi:hypothetical protein
MSDVEKACGKVLRNYLTTEAIHVDDEEWQYALGLVRAGYDSRGPEVVGLETETARLSNRLLRLSDALHGRPWGGDDSTALRCPHADSATATARAEEREKAAKVVDEWLTHYPEDIFIPPQAGQHGKTVDACSAAALRGVLPNLAAAIRSGDEDDTDRMDREELESIARAEDDYRKYGEGP